MPTVGRPLARTCRSLYDAFLEYAGSVGGNVAMIAALAGLPMAVLAGGAVDVWNASSIRSELQAASDAGALAGARYLAENRADVSGAEETSRAFVSRSLAHRHYDMAVRPQATLNEGAVTLTTSVAVPNAFLGLIGIPVTTVEVRAKAQIRPAEGSSVCVHALSATATRAYLASGGSIANAPACTVWINSNASDAVELSGGSTLTAARNCFVGGVKQGLSRIKTAPEQCGLRPDPFSSMTVSSGACTFNGFRGSKTVTLTPGVYCGGITLTGGAQVEVTPGVYVIRDGKFVMSGGGTMHGDGVTFVIEGASTVNLSGGGSYWLRAPKDGPTASFLFFQKHDASPGETAIMSGGGDLYYEGIVYFPTQNIRVSGGGSTTTTSPFTAYIGNTFNYSGGSTLNINVDRMRTSVPVPSALYPETGGVVLVE